MDIPTKTITYHFALEDGSSLSHTVALGTPESIPADAPEWAKHSFYPCTGYECTDSDYCPVALSLVEPLKLFSTLVSYTRARVTVTTPEREYRKDTDMQTAISALFGLIMATSGCPTMEPFRLMAWYHLPFSTMEETFFRLAGARALAMHLEGRPVTLPLLMEEIDRLYARTGRVNQGLVARLRKAATLKADSSLNALVILDGFSSLLPLTADEQVEGLRALMGN